MEFLAAACWNSSPRRPQIFLRCARGDGDRGRRRNPRDPILQALDIILSNVDMATDDTGPICQDTGMPTFVIHTPVGVNQIRSRRRSSTPSPKRLDSESCAPIPWTLSRGRTAQQPWRRDAGCAFRAMGSRTRLRSN